MKYATVLLISLIFYSFQNPLIKEKPNKVTEVYIFLEEDCRISQFYTNTLNDLHQQFANEHITFTGVFPSQTTKQKDISEFKKKYGIPFNLIFDNQQVLTKKFGATITPEVVVYQPDEKKVIYKGRIDNSYFRVGKRRNVVTTNELKHVLNCVKNNSAIKISWKEAIGCYIKII
ncbi:MAG: redoxin domain-containing protein [Bacteroidota bacterium]